MRARVRQPASHSTSRPSRSSLPACQGRPCAPRAAASVSRPPPTLTRVAAPEAFDPGEDPQFDRLLRVAAAGAPSMARLLDVVLLGQEEDYERAGGEGARQAEAVTLMTLHAAKGLEFPVVFICGVEDGLIPYRERDADLAEERRVFYVGLTRARDEVVLTSARSRLQYGKRIRPEVSAFVREIPEGLLSEEYLEPQRKGREAEQLSLW